MFLPLHDGVPLKNMKTPLATRCLIALCIVVYGLTFYGPLGEDEMVGGLAFIPSVLFGTEVLPDGYPFVPVELTLATNIFLHGSLFHLIGNMLFLWVFGDNVEDAMGHLRFVAVLPAVRHRREPRPCLHHARNPIAPSSGRQAACRAWWRPISFSIRA